MMSLTRDELTTAFAKIGLNDASEWLINQTPKPDGDLGYTLASFPDPWWYSRLVLGLAFSGTLPFEKVTACMKHCLQEWSSGLSALPASAEKSVLEEQIRLYSIEFVPLQDEDSKRYCMRILRSDAFFAFPGFYANWERARSKVRSNEEHVQKVYKEKAAVVSAAVLSEIGTDVLIEALANTLAPTIVEGPAA